MKHSLKGFDPTEVARLDTAMWQAYYSRAFFKLLVLLYKLIRTQFKTGVFSTVRTAYFSARAAQTFKHGNYDAAKSFLRKYFSQLRKNSLETFDPKIAADLELKWWLVHRYPNKYEETLGYSLAHAMAELYQTKPQALIGYGEARAKAMHLRDEAKHTHGSEPDWQAIQSQLEKAYGLLQQAVNSVK